MSDQRESVLSGTMSSRGGGMCPRATFLLGLTRDFRAEGPNRRERLQRFSACGRSPGESLIATAKFIAGFTKVTEQFDPFAAPQVYVYQWGAVAAQIDRYLLGYKFFLEKRVR